MNPELKEFCDMIRKRSEENRRAMLCFARHIDVLSPAVSILRQELDSMIRVIYLLSIKDLAERNKLVHLTMTGRKWKRLNAKGKIQEIRDNDMVDIADNLQNWTRFVYEFGCAFIHLSDFHNHYSKNPFSRLPTTEKTAIINHMRNYHGGPAMDNPSIEQLSIFLPNIFEKISGNLGSYLDQLVGGEFINED